MAVCDSEDGPCAVFGGFGSKDSAFGAGEDASEAGVVPGVDAAWCGDQEVMVWWEGERLVCGVWMIMASGAVEWCWRRGIAWTCAWRSLHYLYCSGIIGMLDRSANLLHTLRYY